MEAFVIMVNTRHFPFQTCQGMLQVLEGAQKGPFFPVLLVSLIIRPSCLQRTKTKAPQAWMSQGCRKQAWCSHRHPLSLQVGNFCWACLSGAKWKMVLNLVTCLQGEKWAHRRNVHVPCSNKVWFLEITSTKVRLSQGLGRFFILLEKHQRMS